jgi:hypothetical protein
MSATPNDFIPESGTRPTRIEYVRETSRGEVPSDPEWNTYSDHIENWWGWEPEANKNAVQPHGSSDPDFTQPGSETHEGNIQYWLQQWLVDGSGNAQDAASDAMLVGSDNTFNNTHSTVSRMDVSQNGADSAGYRVYHVGKGGAPVETTLPFEPDEGTPVMVDLSYQWDKMRTYRIDQPSASTTLDVVSSDANDTTQTLTIENEGAGTTEDVSLNGTTSVTTTETFEDIDAAELDAETAGDITISDGSGTDFMVIQGSNSYPSGEGDLGVPALGSGSHASAIGSDYVVFNDDTYDYQSGEIAAEIISGELTVSMESDDNAVTGTPKRNIYSNGRRATWTATVAGEATSVDHVVDYLTQSTFTIEWTADEGTVSGPDAEHFSPGESAFEAGNGKHQRDLTFQSSGVNIS